MAYSMDLRRRVVGASEAKEGSMREVAVRFAVDLTTVRDWVKLKRETGDLVARRGGGRVRLMEREGDQVVVVLVAERGDATLPELREQLRERTHLAVSQATMSRALKRLGLTRKKNSLRRRA
jgi:transposase